MSHLFKPQCTSQGPLLGSHGLACSGLCSGWRGVWPQILPPPPGPFPPCCCPCRAGSGLLPSGPSGNQGRLLAAGS